MFVDIFILYINIFTFELHSLKLTARPNPSKWMVGIRSFPIGFRPIFRGYAKVWMVGLSPDAADAASEVWLWRSTLFDGQTGQT